MKQVTEKYFKEDVMQQKNVFIQKIQVNPFAFTATSADYLIQNKNNDILCEVKEVRMVSRISEPKFVISRLTQESKLFEWENRLERNKSFVFFCFWARNKLNSSAYLVPINFWVTFRKKWTKSDIDPIEFERFFGKYSVKLRYNHWILDF